MNRLSCLVCFMLSMAMSYSSAVRAQNSAPSSHFVFDDFEQIPQPGTFFFDGQGKTRWHDISYEPFMAPKFLLGEAKLLLAQQKYTQLALAETPPVSPQREIPDQPIAWSQIDPVGIAGSLILAGSELPDAALDTFFELAQGTKSRVVVLREGASTAAAEETARMLAHWEQKQGQSLQVLRLPADKKEDVGSHLEALGKATGVWLVGSNRDRLRELLVDSEVGAACRAVLDRGGVVGAADASATLLTTARLADNGDKILTDGLGLLPEAILYLTAAGQDSQARLLCAIRPSSGVIGYEVDAKAKRAKWWDVGEFTSTTPTSRRAAKRRKPNRSRTGVAMI